MSHTETQAIETEVNLQGSNDRDVEGKRISWIDLAIVIARDWRLIAKFAGGVAICTVVFVLFLPNVYTASTTLLPPQQAQSSLAMLANPLAMLGGSGLSMKTPSDQYAAMLGSESVQNAMVVRFDLAKVYAVKHPGDGRIALAQATKILIRSKEGLIDVSVTDRDPARSAQLANAYVEELFKLTSRLAISEAGQRRLFYEKQLQEAKDDLVKAEMAMKQTQQKTGILAVDPQAKATIESLATLRAQIASQEVRVHAMSLSMTDQSSDLALARQELQGLKIQLQKLQFHNGGDGDLQVGTKDIPGASLEYIRAFRELKYQETLYEALAKQYEIARMDEAKSAQIIQVVDEAAVPERKSGPKRTFIVIGMTLLGLLFGTAYVVSRNAYRRFAGDDENGSKLALLRGYLRLRSSR